MPEKLEEAYSLLESAWEREKDRNAETIEEIEQAMQKIEQSLRG